MNGSAKQVAWAQDILGTARAAAEKIAAAIATVTGGTPDQQERRQLIIDRLLTEYRETNVRWANAKTVIDNRDLLAPGFIISTATLHGSTADDKAAFAAKQDAHATAERATLPVVAGAFNIMGSPLLGWTPDAVTGTTTKVSFAGHAFHVRDVRSHGAGFIAVVNNRLNDDDADAACGIDYGVSIYFECGHKVIDHDYYADDRFGTDLLGRDGGWMRRLSDASGAAA